METNALSLDIGDLFVDPDIPEQSLVVMDYYHLEDEYGSIDEVWILADNGEHLTLPVTLPLVMIPLPSEWLSLHRPYSGETGFMETGTSFRETDDGYDY